MEIFVESRGLAQEQDYRWTHYTSGGLVIESCPEIIRASKYANTEEQSLVLLRQGQRLMLLLNHLRCGRRDFNGRPIRNAVAWLGDESDEPALRGLAARRLNELSQGNDETPKTLEQAVDGAIQTVESLGMERIPDGVRRCGFAVDGPALERLAKDSEAAKTAEPAPEPDQCHKDRNVPETRTALAGILVRYRLPRRDGPLVVVARFTRPELLRKDVWRGMTELEEQAPNPFARKARIRGAIFLAAAAVCLLGLLMVYNGSAKPTEISLNGPQIRARQIRPAETNMVPRIQQGMTVEILFDRRMKTNRLPTVEVSSNQVIAGEPSWDADEHVCRVPLSIAAGSDPNRAIPCQIEISGIHSGWGHPVHPLTLGLEVEAADIDVQLTQPASGNVVQRGQQMLHGNAFSRYGVREVLVNGQTAHLESPADAKATSWQAVVELPTAGRQVIVLSVQDIYSNQVRRNATVEVKP